LNPHLQLLEQSHERADTLASQIGLNDFSAGRHIPRDHRNWKTGEIEVATTWMGLIMPSFADHTAIVTFDMPSRSHERKPLNPIRRTAVARFEKDSVQPLDILVLDTERRPDPLTDTLGILPWNSPTWHLTLDGTLYTFLSHTMIMSAFLVFANPNDESLRNLVSQLLKTEKEVRQGGSPFGNP